MKSSIVFVVEKSSAAQALAGHISKRWPDRSVYAIPTMYLGLYEFRYPRGLSIASFPYVSEPVWQPRRQLGGATWPVWLIDGGTLTRIDRKPADVLREADTVENNSIWFAGEPDASGVVAYQVLLAECLGGATFAGASRPALHLAAYDSGTIEAAFDARSTTGDDWFVGCLAAGTARRFFDFNYNVNSLALFGAALRHVGVSTEKFAMSKYSLQLLYSLRERPAESEAALCRRMETWAGTGRHVPSPLGSPASRWPIVTGLQDAGLITFDRENGITISAAGTEFLGLLHPDCCDADLPARMRQWEEAWPATRPAIERYLRTFFGKQKRFGVSKLALS
ncbi:hypothetical protein [Burkholderia cenocepacia]|uniref:hypothetical protein n=1 Tax=Burkholderia cenocepacia TaxID=95486 RepID=UPI002ABE8FC3|nr:hypothetical protein [Burkholderia cenocepacia]